MKQPPGERIEILEVKKVDVEELIDKPVLFFRELGKRYVFKDAKLSNLLNELANEHRGQELNGN